MPVVLRALRDEGLTLVLVADVCLCGYTSHGHCGVLEGDRVANDGSLPRLVDAALAYVEAGADVVAPSAMMDGQVGAIRAALEAVGREDAAILAYAAKVASSLYGRSGMRPTRLRPSETGARTTAIARAGADIIVTYLAADIRRLARRGTVLTAQGSAAWRRRAEDVLPGGVDSPVRAWRAVDGMAPIIVRGKGAQVWDADGRGYVDLVGSFGPHLLGHAHRGVSRAIREALRDGGPFGATHPAEVRLAERIRAAMPSMERIRFTSSGTEAVMSALRVARAATDRWSIVTFAGGYHGHADALLASAGSGLATQGLPASAGVDPSVTAGTIVLPYNDLGAVSEAFRSHGRRIAAVIVEPVAANMGVIAPAPGFLEGLREVTRRHGALLVFDEVITGFRVGPGGAGARYGVIPDLTILGRVIGGGLPIGAFGGAREVMDLLAPLGPVYQAGTLAGHPLAMAAGEAMLTAATEAVYARLERLGRRLEAGLRDLATGRAREPVSVARVGSLLTLFFRPRPPRDLEEAEDSDAVAFARFHAGLWTRGVLVPPSRFEAWFISAAHRERDIDAVVSASREALAEAL